MPPPILRSDVLELSDLVPDMRLTGTVRNVTDFGVFVDIGVHQDGLVHISEMSDKRISHPSDIAAVGVYRRGKGAVGRCGEEADIAVNEKVKNHSGFPD